MQHVVPDLLAPLCGCQGVPDEWQEGCVPRTSNAESVEPLSAAWLANRPTSPVSVPTPVPTLPASDAHLL